MTSISREQFERLVSQALSDLPDDFRHSLQNVDIVVGDVASMNQIVGTGIENAMDLLGLYEGIPLTARNGYDMVLPDKVTIFQKPIESICDTEEEVAEETSKTLIHEIAHHFGLDDEHLDRLESG